MFVNFIHFPYDAFYDYLKRKLSRICLINFTPYGDYQYYFYFLIMSRENCIIMLFVNSLHVFPPSGNKYTRMHACSRAKIHAHVRHAHAHKETSY